MKVRFGDVERVLVDTQKWILTDLKDVEPVTSRCAVLHSSSSNSTTKKEAVHLPHFKGDEKTIPFLRFPIWKKQWETLIEEYEVDYRFSFLSDNPDEAAQTKLVGCETEYEEMMRCLSMCYGDKTKIVSCVMKEVNAPRTLK